MSVANSYAKALYESAVEQKLTREQMSQVETELDLFANVLDSSKELRVALFGPIASTKEKESVVENLASLSKFSSLTTRFLSIAAGKDRLTLIRQMRDAFAAARLSAEGGVAGKVVVAEAIDQADVDDLAAAFSKKLGKPVAFRVSTDASLLAGMKVTVGGITYDGSLRAQLQRLRDRFLAGVTNS